MNAFKKVSQHYFTPEQIRKIENTKVCIAGCGGLGSNIAHMLVRCGFRKFVLIDYDLVEEKNLNRQFFFPDQAGLLKTDALVQNLHMINHDLATETITDKFESFRDIKDRVKDCHIFIEAFDDPRSKATFVNGVLGSGMKVNYLIAASGIAGFGKSDDIVVKKISDTFFIVGDGSSDIKDSPPLSPRVMVVAAKQADLVLEISLNRL